ncbi:MAG: DUF4126 domain-containing protein [bacterium]
MFWEWVFIISFAVILSAFTGIRAFLPLTLTALLAKFNLLSVKSFYNIPFIEFLTDDRVLAFLVIATVIEVVSDKIPAVDNFLDGVYSLLKPVISFVSIYGIFQTLEPWQSAILAITFSLISTSTMMGTKSAVRLASTSTTAGTVNPVISFLEDLFVTIKTLLALLFSWLLPIIAFIVLIFVFILMFVFVKFSLKFLKSKVFLKSRLQKLINP